MVLSNKVVTELKRELASLRHYRNKADADIQAIERLLANVASKRDRPAVATHSQQPTASLRFHVMETLQKVSKATAADVAQRLQADGFRVGGATSLRERVTHELSRLRRKGLVRRHRNGQYMVRIVQLPPTTTRATAKPAGAGPVVN